MNLALFIFFLFIFIFCFSSYFIFGFTFYFFILVLGKEYNMMLYVTVIQVTKHDRDVISITEWSHMSQSQVTRSHDRRERYRRFWNKKYYIA